MNEETIRRYGPRIIFAQRLDRIYKINKIERMPAFAVISFIVLILSTFCSNEIKG